MPEKVVILHINLEMLLNEDKTSKEAYDILSKYNIPFAVGVDKNAEPVTIVTHGSDKYVGLEQIKKFAQEWQENHASQRHGCGCGSGCGCAE